MQDYLSARMNMVENQLRPNRVFNPRVLAAFAEVPREIFVPSALRSVAYSDEDLDLGADGHLIEPLVLGRMLQIVSSRPVQVGLVIGCDTGYCAAVLAKMADTVFLLAEDQPKTDVIDEKMNAVGADNVVVQAGNPAEGLPGQAPFDAIVLAGSVGEVPRSLLRQLSDGGRLVAVVQKARTGRITVWHRIEDRFGEEEPFDAVIPPLHAFKSVPSFTF